MMYATMWALNIQFYPHTFAVTFSFLAYIRIAVVDFFSFAVKDFVHFLSAQKRIQVCLNWILFVHFV